jgi:four helix bundle protein
MAASMSVQSEQLKERTMQFAVDVLRLIDEFPRKTSAEVIGRQLAKSATSVAANYRATCNARSRAEFIAKLGVVVEEADESVGWLDMIGRAQLLNAERLDTIRGLLGYGRYSPGRSGPLGKISRNDPITR